ncbi:GumC family protein [Falsirhodobacter algicola]|uniref:Lipopolysaccharide biosynthesis protein n=1 Tax=Falsirhodobacter algicola TaxID=2692330 RepID=A0A8J8MR08_9RHOB|nr:exopolysaccharide transport family protein [Falsirhodobacter algicola]QUS35120.1 hypothetical protein GR316_01815 [Falsirhodobacter algicola]
MNDQFHPRSRADRARMRLAPPPPLLREGETEIDWLQLVRMVRRRLPLIAALTAGLTVLSLPLILSQVPEYAARARVILSQPLPATLSTDPNDPRPAGLDISTEMERLSARSTVEAVVAKMNLADNPDFAAPPEEPGLVHRAIAGVRGLFGGTVEPAADPDLAEAALQSFYERLSVRRVGDTGVLEVGFTAPEPKLAADAANTLVQTYATLRDDQQQARLTSASSWLEARIAAQSARQDAARTRAQTFRQTHNLGTETTPSPAMQTVSALTQQHDRLTEERATLTATLAMIGTASAYPATPLPGEPETLTTLRAQFQRQQQEEEQLRSRYGDSYGGAVQARGQSALTRDQIARGVDAYAEAMRSRLSGLDAETEAVEARLRDARAGLSQQGTAELEMAGLQRDLDAETQILSGLERQARLIQAEASLPVVQVEVLSPAMPPSGAEGYGRKVYLLLALMLSGCLAILCAAILEVMDRTVRSTDQLRGAADIAPVGMLPALPGRGDLLAAMRQRPLSAFADALRGLMLTMEVSSGGAMPRSLLVTSARAGEGASTVASALALALAAGGQPVLLVQIERAPGAEPPPAAGIDRLRLNEMPSQAGLTALLDRATQSGSILILDAPPVLSSTAAQHLAGMADRSLLVVRWAATPRRLVELAAERLALTGGERVLCALNAVDLDHHAGYGFRDSVITALPRRA